MCNHPLSQCPKLIKPSVCNSQPPKCPFSASGAELKNPCVADMEQQHFTEPDFSTRMESG